MDLLLPITIDFRLIFEFRPLSPATVQQLSVERVERRCLVLDPKF